MDHQYFNYHRSDTTHFLSRDRALKIMLCNFMRKLRSQDSTTHFIVSPQFNVTPQGKTCFSDVLR